jgi:intracellular multiplication protein IcmB
MNNIFLAAAEMIHDTIGGGSAETHCQWRGAVAPSQRLDNGAYISELLQDSHISRTDISANPDDAPMPEPYSLEMADGTLVSFLLVRGARTNMRENDTAHMADLVSAKVAAYMAGGSGSSYSFGMYFLHDPQTAAQVFEQKIAPMLATAKRLGGDAESYKRDLGARLANGAAEEMTLLTVRTHMKALRADEHKRVTEQYQTMVKKIIESGKGVKNMPLALQSPFGQILLSRSPAILQRHEGIVKTLLNDFNSRNIGLSMQMLAVREAFERVRRFGDREIPFQPGWMTRMLGQEGGLLAATTNEGVPTPLSLGMQVLNRKVIGHIDNYETASLGHTWYGTAVMEIGPVSPRKHPSQTIFSALMSKVRGVGIPISISYEIFPSGLAYNRLNQLLNSFLAPVNATNRQIRDAYKELRAHEERSGTTDPIVGLRVSFSTWARSKELAESALLELDLAVRSWGSMQASHETGQPDVARLSAIPEYTTTSCAPVVPAPLADVIYMSPIMRPASPWDFGQLQFKTNDGVIYPVQIGSRKHASFVTGLCAPSGSGKSFLLNRIMYCLSLTPGAQQLPYGTYIDVGYSGKGFLRHLRTVLPKSLHSQLVYFKVLNEASNCVNPHDLQLGCTRPTGAETDFLVAVYEVIFKGLGDETSSFINALIKEAYRMFSPDSTDAKLWQQSLDERVNRELGEIGFKWPEQRDPTVYEVVDALFDANRIEAARIAQRYAVPMLEDMTRVVNSERITRVYGDAKVGDELLLQKASRALLTATNEFPVIAGVTRMDMDNARISVIDLQNVLGASSASGVEFAGMMYLYARHLGARNFFLDVDEIGLLARPQYKEYQVRRVREIQQTPKVLTYDEWHNVKNVKGLVGLNAKETRETRKFKVYLNFVTQYITDYPEEILAGMTTVMVVGQQAEAHNVHAHKELALSTTDLDILRNGLDRQGRIWLWFRLRDGMVTAVVDNEVGPIEAWCYTTDDNDSPLRAEMEERIGETEAMKFLAKEFPTGSAASYLEQRRRQQGAERQGEKTATITSIVADELAGKYHESLRKGHLQAA